MEDVGERLELSEISFFVAFEARKFTWVWRFELKCVQINWILINVKKTGLVVYEEGVLRFRTAVYV